MPISGNNAKETNMMLYPNHFDMITAAIAPNAIPISNPKRNVDIANPFLRSDTLFKAMVCRAFIPIPVLIPEEIPAMHKIDGV